MKIHRFILLLTVPLYFFSCTTQQRLPNYLEHMSDTSGKKAVKYPELRIQKNDLLSIQIHSLSTKPEESDLIYNQITTTATPAGTSNVSTTGYLVDAEGNIEHHRLGVIHAEGLTKQQLAAEIKKRLTTPVELLKDPTVIIRFMNFHVSVMGDVAKAGVIYVPGERINIFEALALAGDVNQWGMKSNIRVVREIDGVRETGLIDLSSEKAFESPYFYLLQNDIVNVDPSPQKAKNVEQSITAQKVSLALSIATVMVAITNIFLSTGKN